MILNGGKFKLLKKTCLALSAAVVMTFALSSAHMSKAYASSNVAQLKVSGSSLCTEDGNKVQLKGMSSHGLQWYGDYMNYDSMKYLRDNWGANVVRAAMYTDQGGYIANPQGSKAKVEEIVQDAIDLNMYVIIDWHILNDYNPNTYKEQSKEFFEEMASKYGNYPNVIYEICNEPNGGVQWSDTIKPYAEYITSAIRKIDPDNIIIVGTSTWSQDVDVAANDPLNESNIMYACHFYAGSHGQFLRDKINNAMSKGAAVFVTEWGTSDASGNGGPYINESKAWVDYMADKNISWCNWSLCDKGESSAALKSGASKNGGWSDSDLSASGLFVRDSIRAGRTNSGNADSDNKGSGKGSSESTDIKTESKVSDPVFSLGQGTYDEAQNVSLSCKTDGATIYYTTDGTEPTKTSAVYYGPVNVAETTQIKAIAVKDNMSDSNVVSATYTISEKKTDDSNTDVTNPENSDLEVVYNIQNDWGCGATVNVTIKNNGSAPINSWNLTWAKPDNITVTNMWNGSYSLSNNDINVKSMGYNGTINPGGTCTFGFNLSYSGSNVKPSEAKLNGSVIKVK